MITLRGPDGKLLSPYPGLKERLLWNTENVDDHWLWLRGTNRCGYARINIYHDGKIRCFLAHRVAYELWIGSIPAEHDLDHGKECPRHCINPYHLSPMHYLEHRKKTAWPKANPGRTLQL